MRLKWEPIDQLISKRVLLKKRSGTAGQLMFSVRY